MKKLTLENIMGDDHIIYAELYDKTKPEGDIKVTIINENDDIIVYDHSGAPASWESLVYFAKQVLDEDRRLQQTIEAYSE